jgi:hypothetical protein
MTSHSHDICPQYLFNKDGHKTSVVLSIEEFENLLEDLEDLTAIAERQKEITMKNITVELLQAHKKLTEFLEKVTPANELYLEEFLSDLQVAKNEVKTNQFDEVKNFNDFIS